MHLFISQAVDVVNVMNGLDNGSWLQVEGCESSEEEHSLPAPAVAAAEKVGESGEKEDRLRAAAIRGVPPPPPGYLGGFQPGYNPNPLPPSSAVYPRQ